MLQLGNPDASGDVLNHRSLTVSAGSHPLFQGVKNWTILLDDEPKLGRESDPVEVAGPGLALTVRNAEIETKGRVIFVHLPR